MAELLMSSVGQKVSLYIHPINFSIHVTMQLPFCLHHWETNKECPGVVAFGKEGKGDRVQGMKSAVNLTLDIHITAN